VRGIKAKGGAVVDRPETRVDGYSSPREKKLGLQVSKIRVVMGARGQLGGGII
jgi:hypothetical protein